MVRLIPILAAAVLLSGCGGVWLPETVERRAGDLLEPKVLEELPLAAGNRWAPFLDDAGRKLAAVSERPDYGYRFRIVRSKQVNALALPNGDIFVTEELLRVAGRDAEAVAAVLGHEIGHVARRHSAETLQSKIGIDAAGILVFGIDRSLARAVASLGAQLMELGYGRDMELEADLCAIRYLVRLGYPPATGLKFLKVLAAREHEEASAIERYLRSHPPTAERLRYAQAYAERLAAEAGEAKPR